MRRLILIALAAAAAFVLASPISAEAVPSVRVLSKDPLVLRGVGFEPVTPVTIVVITTERPVIRHMRTGPAGGFLARFAVSVDPCNGATSARVTARGGYGATLRLAPPGVCAPLQPV